jgi:translation initiation factor 4A
VRFLDLICFDKPPSVFQVLPRDVQIAFFTCTMPSEVVEVSKATMRDPVNIRVKRDEKLSLDGLSLEHLKQFYIPVEKEEWKLETLYDFYDGVTISQAIVFCNSRERVESLAEQLQTRGMSGVSAMVRCTSFLSPWETRLTFGSLA